MEWIPVYSHDTPETLVISGYECDNCGYVAHRQWLQCPHCNAVWTGVIANNATQTNALKLRWIALNDALTQEWK